MIARIARGAVSFEQSYYHQSHGWFDRYQIRVTYPNGYGASIVCCDAPEEGQTYIWDVFLLKDGKCCGDDDWDGEMASQTNEEEVVKICDRIYFM